MNDQIKCPHCGKKFPVSEALSRQIEEQLSKKYLDQLKEKDRNLEEAKRTMWKKALILAEEKVKEKSTDEVKFLKEQVEEQNKKLDQARKSELDLRKEKIRLEDKEKELELKAQRVIDEERRKIIEETYKKAAAENRFKELEKNKQMDDMRKQIEDLKRKSEQGSQQLQGDVQEVELKNILKREFPFDDVKDVPTGIKGADVLQIVRNNYGKECGMIVWESKRTKIWSDGWIAKLKEDKRQVNADVAVIISQVLPTGVRNFIDKNGVLIGNFEMILALGTLIRNKLLELAMSKASLKGKEGKKEILWDYLRGKEFFQRLEAISDAYTQLQYDIEVEKRWFTRKWSKQEKNIRAVIDNIVGMHGDLQHIVGRDLPEMKGLESLPSGDKDKLF